MYRLFRSEPIPCHGAVLNVSPLYRQVQLHQFQKLEAALCACDIYNTKPGSRHYILNDTGRKLYDGQWID